MVILDREQESLFPEIEPPDGKEFSTLLAHEERPRQANHMHVPPVEAKLVNIQRWKLWCPYCGRLRQFKKHTYSGTRRCEGCGVSSRDFAVRQANRLWLKD
ncbi:MAG: hypothetical protein ACM3NT_01970 [Methylocystaceae bacterium]